MLLLIARYWLDLGQLSSDGPWRTRDATEIAIIDWIDWIDWIDAVRLHGEIGDVPPAEHEADWYRHNPTARAVVTT